MSDGDSENKKLARRTPEWFRFYLDEFEKESDRAAVIHTCALIDNALRELLEIYMLSCPASADPLFDGANAPLSSFSERIEISYRLGLITRDLASGLTTLRKIRNSFAHDVGGCSFDSQSVRDRVESLTHLAGATREQLERVEAYSWIVHATDSASWLDFSSGV
jgi:DNA-binding MltR family transcriptional regulator